MIFRFSLTCALLSLSGLVLAQKPGAASPPEIEISEEEQLQIANSCVRPEDAARPMSDFTAAQRQALVACAMRASSAAMNRQLPMRLDEITTLERTSAEGATVTYHARLDVAVSELPQNAPQLLADASRSFVCANTNMVDTIGYGGSYRYSWIDRAGARVHQVLIDRC